MASRVVIRFNTELPARTGGPASVAAVGALSARDAEPGA
jgi:hypothetical protein